MCVEKDLPKTIEMVDFGGGEGALAKAILKYLTSKGRRVDAKVLDGNPEYLKIAKAKGLSTIFSNIGESKLKNIGLATMRAVIHYNSPEKQQKMFDKICGSLKKGGYFVHQNSGGSEENCKLRSDIVNLKWLGRTPENKKYKWLSEKECLQMAKRAGFRENFIAGYAPSNAWGPIEQWERFNKKMTDAAKATGDKARLKEIENRRKKFLSEANRLVERYLKTYKNKGNDIKRAKDGSYLIEYAYPIIVSRK